MAAQRGPGIHGDFAVLTFDCYGTLIDWETGIVGVPDRFFRSHGRHVAEEETLAQYATYESRAEAGRYRPYREVLRDVMRQFARAYDLELAPDERRLLEADLGNWRPFPDTVPALQRLKPRYRLAILSNIDDDLFARTARHLHIAWDAVITAQQLGVYKPDRRFFAQAIERLGVPPDRILHVAQSLYHDIAPARSLGMRTVWVRRSRIRRGCGATPDAQAQPDGVVDDLHQLAEQLLAM